MKRRTKLTPFAKIVILALVFLGARYVYLHQDKILEMEFFNLNDTTEVNTNKKNVVVDEGESEDVFKKDTIDLFITQTGNVLRIQTSDTIVEINKKDTLIYTVSDKENLIGRIILN